MVRSESCDGAFYTEKSLKRNMLLTELNSYRITENVKMFMNDRKGGKAHLSRTNNDKSDND